MDRESRRILMNIKIKRVLLFAFLLMLGMALFFLADSLFRYLVLK